MKARDGDAAGLVESDPLALEQGPFHGRAALVAAEGAVRADGPVTGHDDRERIRGQGVAHGPGGAGLAEAPGDEPVGADAAARNGVLGPQDRLLERGARRQRGDVERKDDILAGQGSADRRRDAVDLAA